MEQSATGFRVLLAILVLLIGCKDIERPPIYTLLSGRSSSGRVGIVSTDFGSAGRFTSMTPDGVPIPGLSPIHSDAIARFQNNQVTIINRLNRDNIQVLEPSFGFLTVQEFSVGSGSNPHDYIRVSDALGYVTLYERSFLQMVQPATGFIAGNIPLAAYADSDGVPEMDGMLLEGDLLYVALQRLDRNQSNFPPAGISKLIEIDIRTNTVTGVYDFPAPNPFGRLKRVTLFGSPYLVVSCPGRLGFISALDGGVVAFDLTARAFRPGFLFAETAAAGDILDVEIVNDSLGYVSVLDAAFNKSVQQFNPSSGVRTAVLFTSPASTGTVAGLLYADGYLYAGDASFSQPGIRIFDALNGGAQITPVPVNVGLRPYSLIQIPPL
ncbi:MAG: hypothetical protein K8S54_11650 [Spirochaetia bacterium]|nr:hypothetical protein [Spirochaetia bacterium]